MLYGDRSRQELEEYAEKLFAKSEVIKDRTSRRNLYDELMDHFGLEVIGDLTGECLAIIIISY